MRFQFWLIICVNSFLTPYSSVKDAKHGYAPQSPSLTSFWNSKKFPLVLLKRTENIRQQLTASGHKNQDESPKALSPDLHVAVAGKQKSGKDEPFKGKLVI